jgi:hypothetical protein
VVVAVVPAELVVQLAVVASSHVPAAVVPPLEPAVAPLVSQYTVVCANACTAISTNRPMGAVRDLIERFFK